MKKFLKVLFIIILVIIAIPLIGALFVKKEYAISRFVTINRPPEQVYGYLSHIKNQDQFSKWNRMDPNMKRSFNGTDGTLGFTYAWDSDKDPGKGIQEIKELMPNQEIHNEVRFEKPFESTMQARFKTESAGNGQTIVTWAIDGRNKYPLNFMNLFMPKMMGVDMDSSLAMLKSNLERQ